MDGVIVNFQTGIDALDPDLRLKFSEHLDEAPRIFSLMLPFVGAVESVKTLMEKYDVYILSTAPWKNWTAWSDKLLWVQKYFGECMTKRLILSHNKHRSVLN